MTVIPFAPPGGTAPREPMPSNIPAEQALLGCILYDNAAYERLSDSFAASHLHEPFHARLFAAMESHIRKGQLAEPILLAEQFGRDPAFAELGGISYLADLVDRAPPAVTVNDYAREVSELARRRDLIRIGGELVVSSTAPEPDVTSVEILQETEAKLYALGETGTASQGFQTAETYLANAVAMAAAAYAQDGGLSGISTGLSDLDRRIGGLHSSDLVIIAARPGMGKTSLAVNIAFNVARRYAYEVQPDGSHKTTAGGRVAFFSLEMSADQLGLRLLAEASRVSGDRLRKGEIQDHEFGQVRDACLEIQSMPLLVDDTGGLAISKLAARARRMKRQGGLDLIVVDYLQLVTTGLRTNNRVEEVSLITQGLKALAKDLDVPVIALSQLSRQVESRDDKRPQLSDLRESGSIEQDADMVMFIYREEYYVGQAEPDPKDAGAYNDWRVKMDECRGHADLIIGKQRHGPTGTVRLAFNSDLTTFSDLAQASYGGAAR